MLDLMPQSRRGGVNTEQYTVRGPNSVPRSGSSRGEELWSVQRISNYKSLLRWRCDRFEGSAG